MKKQAEQSMKKLSRKQIAELFDKDPTTISRWLERGLPRNPDGSYNGYEVLRWVSNQRWLEF